LVSDLALVSDLVVRRVAGVRVPRVRSSELVPTASVYTPDIRGRVASISRICHGPGRVRDSETAT
jgi:hypothetical protein